MDQPSYEPETALGTTIRAAPAALQQTAEACRPERLTDPCLLVIMGATGDLTARKLMPALFNLYGSGTLPDAFAIVGCGRSALSDAAFRTAMARALEAADAMAAHRWPEFAARLFYRSVDFNDPESFMDLAGSLRAIDDQIGSGGNRIFYMALPPALYQPVAQLVGQAGLAAQQTAGQGWSRFVVEKPFGRDLASAMDLDRVLHQYFEEPQIFRIDHYLAKETVQNILMLRFANAIFEPIWNRRYIEQVHITAAEILGVEHRAAYYESSGVLRDMFQNHMMQLLALTAMEPPPRFEADRVRDEKAKVFHSLRPFAEENLDDHLVLGQYGPGMRDGRKVVAYRQEQGVDPASLTPTYAMLKVFIDNWRWQGVPFYLTSGKRLARKLTRISIRFREVPHALFRQTLGEAIQANELILGIYPDEKISLTFQTKNPGARMCLRPVTMDFEYNQGYQGPALDAYEKVLIDCMAGDQMLFWRQDGVEHCWSFLTPVLNACETCDDRAQRLQVYEAGSWGPARATQSDEV